MLIAFEKKLKDITLKEGNVFKRQEKSVELCVNTLRELKDSIIKKGFTTKQKEIDFFKTIKPCFESKLKYHVSLFDLEKHKPRNCIIAQRKYFERKLKEIDDFIQSNIEFYTYYKTGATYLDDLYFVRREHNSILTLESCVFDIDLNFRTSHDHKVSQVLADELLYEYLINELASELKNNSTISHVDTKMKLTWTESKTSLIELIYALNSQGAFENANADIKDIATYFENIFNVDLGDYYRTYLEIKIRKSGRTKFLDGMKENLLKRMDFADEN